MGVSSRVRQPAALVVAALLVLGACGSSDGTAETPEQPEALSRYGDYQTANYDDPEHWVCRPDRADICEGNLDSTVVEADGTLTVEPFEAAEDPPIDCFYVYPTISGDETRFADWDFSPDEEGWAALNQAARLQSECRLFAPAYRQRTLVGLGGNGKPDPDNPGDPYADVADAFKTYMATDNEGRGVVLVGHSQGTSMLLRLLAEEFDPHDDTRALLVGAYLPGLISLGLGEDFSNGNPLMAPSELKNIPACTSAGEVGCLYSWASFRATEPPPPVALFGRSSLADGEARCVSPAAPAGGEAPLDAYFPAAVGDSMLSSEGQNDDGRRWVEPGVAEVATPFVKIPGLITGRCVTEDGFSYLSVTVNADPADPRSDDIDGDLSPAWGLHLVDVNLVMGDIITQVGLQAASYLDG